MFVLFIVFFFFACFFFPFFCVCSDCLLVCLTVDCLRWLWCSRFRIPCLLVLIRFLSVPCFTFILLCIFCFESVASPSGRLGSFNAFFFFFQSFYLFIIFCLSLFLVFLCPPSASLRSSFRIFTFSVFGSCFRPYWSLFIALHLSFIYFSLFLIFRFFPVFGEAFWFFFFLHLSIFIFCLSLFFLRFTRFAFLSFKLPFSVCLFTWDLLSWLQPFSLSLSVCFILILFIITPFFFAQGRFRS